MSIPKIIEFPEGEPLTIEECRQHLESQPYGDTDVDALDDAMILALLGAAREHCEDFLGLSLSPRILELSIDTFPSVTDGVGIDLPMGPVREILYISGEPPSTDIDSDSTLAEDSYLLDTYSVPNRVVPVTSWPSVTSATNAIKIRYLAGYGEDSEGGEPLPFSLRAAMLLVLGHLYENREDSTAVQTYEIPLGAQALMRPRRVRLGMA